MLVKSSLNIVSPQESKPAMFIVQNSLIAMHLMSKDNKPIQRTTFFDISMYGETFDGKNLYTDTKIKTIKKVLKKFKKDDIVFNGRGLISLLLPENFNYEKKNNTSPTEPAVKIHNGVYYEGVLDKGVLGSQHGSIIHVLNKEYGPDFAANFIDNVQFISGAWMAMHGYSIGLDDCMITSEKSQETIKDILSECYAKAEAIEETTQNPGIREVRVTAVLSQAKDIGMKIAKDAMSKDNNFLTTVNSQTKGDYFNIAQLTGLLGQQNLEGKRITPQLNRGTRTMPHYPFSGLTKEREYESRGFVRNSFIHGLTPEEFFFHTMSGREGIIDTAMGTANSGYLQRKIVKLYEDIKVQYDGTVRDVSGRIYQFSYGQNGLDPVKTMKVDNKPQICDLGRMMDRLNLEFEEKIEHPCKDDIGPKITPTIIDDPRAVMLQKRQLIKKIKKRSDMKINEEASVEELQQLLKKIKKYEEENKEEEEEDFELDEIEPTIDEEEEEKSEEEDEKEKSDEELTESDSEDEDDEFDIFDELGMDENVAGGEDCDVVYDE